MNKAGSAFALLLLWIGTACSSEARQVSNSAQLKAALAAAKGGETITLAPGRYEDMSLKRGQGAGYSATVTVAPADPKSPPIFTKPTVLHGVRNLTLRGLHFLVADNRLAHQPVLRLYGGQNISLLGNRVEGARDGGGHYGYGLVARDIHGLHIEGNSFSRLNRGIVATRVRSLKINRNDIRDIGHDGMSLANVDGEIVANLIEDFYPREKYHPDGIQFHANRQLAAKDVLIQHNLIIGHPQRRIQGIFMRAGYASDPSQRYRNIRILDNIIAGSRWHGIAVIEADALEIGRNRILHLPGDDRTVARIFAKAATGRAYENSAPRVLLDGGIAGFGNVEAPASSSAEVARVRKAWLARFRNVR